MRLATGSVGREGAALLANGPAGRPTVPNLAGESMRCGRRRLVDSGGRAAGHSRIRWRTMGPQWPDLTVVTDQDARVEHEELLAATGLQHGVLILRKPPPGGGP